MNRDRYLRLLLIFYGLSLIIGIGSLVPWSSLRSSREKGTQKGSIAEVRVYGPIHISMSDSAFGGPDADEIAERLHRLSENDDVKAILLRINSPGGTVAAVQEIHTEILRCKRKGKKVVASLGDVAASGGYYLAAAADHIVADPGTITGSIGVIAQFGNLESLFQKIGVRLQVIKSGEHKDIGSPARALTPEERRLLQASIDDAYAQFVEAVAQGRRLEPSKVRPLADGRIFTGRQAKDVGLVDELGGRRDAVEMAIRLAHLPAHPPILSDSTRSLRSLMRQLSSRGGKIFDAVQDQMSGLRVEYRLP